METMLGDMIRQFRKERGLTQKELGELCELQESAVRRYELGLQNPKIETLDRIAKALGVTIFDLKPELDFGQNSTTPQEKVVPSDPLDVLANIIPAAASIDEAEQSLSELYCKIAERVIQSVSGASFSVKADMYTLHKDSFRIAERFRALDQRGREDVMTLIGRHERRVAVGAAAPVSEREKKDPVATPASTGVRGA